MPVAESDIHFLQFITPWGRYRYKKAPQGYISCVDIYNYKTQQILVDVKNHLKIVDDLLIYATNIGNMYRRTVNFITLCSKDGMVLNPEQFKFGVLEMDFAGFIVGGGIVKLMESHIKAIRNFPEPRNITDMRSFMAMCEQVRYAARIKDDLLPLRDPLRNNSKNFFWDK